LKLHGSVSATQLDEARARATNADAELQRAQATVLQTLAEQGVADGAGRAAKAKVEVTVSGVDVKLAETDAKLAAARVDEAKAAVALAELERTRATIKAPFAGVIERRRVEPGSYASAGAEHFLLVASEGAWIEANFKEAQLGHIAPGQRATIELDAFPGLTLTGHVESVGGATLSRTSLVQVGGAGTGFARTAQRVPVTITLDKAPEAATFASGLNATVTVRVKK
jgi:membrane fusion protein (multidrug efflux system)